MGLVETYLNYNGKSLVKRMQDYWWHRTLWCRLEGVKTEPFWPFLKYLKSTGCKQLEQVTDIATIVVQFEYAGTFPNTHHNSPCKRPDIYHPKWLFSKVKLELCLQESVVTKIERILIPFRTLWILLLSLIFNNIYYLFQIMQLSMIGK